MTRALVLLAVVFAVASTLAIPAHKGAVKKPSVTCPPPTALAQRLKISGSAKDLNAFLCPVCLDIVDLGKDYIECGEEDTQKALDAQCETQNSFWLKQACLDIVNDVAKELEKETDEDIVDSAVCTKRLLLMLHVLLSAVSSLERVSETTVNIKMKIFFVVALAFVSVEASAKFKTANEFTGLRSLLSEWQPANSLKLLDFIGTSFDAVVVRSANETFIDKYIQTVRDSFSEKTGAAASEYDKDLESRRKALTPDALKFLNRQKATFMDFLKRDVAVKWVMSLAEYANQPKAVKESLLASYPSTFGIYEKVAVALKDDA